MQLKASRPAAAVTVQTETKTEGPWHDVGLGGDRPLFTAHCRWNRDRKFLVHQTHVWYLWVFKIAFSTKHASSPISNIRLRKAGGGVSCCSSLSQKALLRSWYSGGCRVWTYCTWNDCNSWSCSTLTAILREVPWRQANHPSRQELPSPGNSLTYLSESIMHFCRDDRPTTRCCKGIVLRHA
jgi:hypothetical protein